MATKTTLVRAKLFRNGRSQAVRLPKEFRFAGDEVTLRREGEAVIMEPVRKRAWPAGFWERIARGRDDSRDDSKVDKLRVVLQQVELDEP
jgi:virulence-associated protein VagC